MSKSAINWFMHEIVKHYSLTERSSLDKDISFSTLYKEAMEKEKEIIKQAYTDGRYMGYTAEKYYLEIYETDHES